MIYLKSHQPRILFLSLGETDDWAHEGNYRRTLEALRQSDDRIRQLWDYLQATPQYRGQDYPCIDHRPWTRNLERVASSRREDQRGSVLLGRDSQP